LDGNASDMSGNSRHGTIYGSNPTEDRHGKMNGAYNFDGIDDYIKINHDKAFNHLPLSISAWFNSKGNSGQAGIVSKYWAAHWNGWQIMDFDGDLVPWYLSSSSPRNVIIGKYGESKAFETKTPLDSWSHATVVFSEGGGALYLNGKEADSMHWTGKASAPTTSQPVTIGLYQGASNGYFKGSIDDVRIYDRALSEDEVLALYELESTNPNEDRPTHTVDLNSTVSLEMIWVKPGTFTMGSFGSSEAHEVTLTKGFYLGKFEVTQDQYEAIVLSNPSNFVGKNKPVEYVSWNAAKAFVEQLNQKESGNLPPGWEYALPTEAEWEFACRAGTTTSFNWASGIDETKANYRDSGIGQTIEVGQYSPNNWGFYDMHGNVREWTNDIYFDYSSNPVTDPTGGVSGDGRVTRGGNYNAGGGDSSSKHRNSRNLHHRHSSLGFRLALKNTNHAPETGGLTPPDPDYKDTIAELKRLLAEKDKKLAHCETEMAAKQKQIGELTSTNAQLQGEVKSLNGKVTGLEQEVATLKSDNEGLKGQIQHLREDNQNISNELTVANNLLEEAIRVAETPFINGWVYDPVRGWLFTDAEHFPLVYTHKTDTWHYYELGSSEPRYFYNYTSQEWVAWDAAPEETQQLVASNNNL
jgi:formylglycine-generating enzyme required for sulfatase activity/FtsZ-binding cell division protein ZapB